MFKSSPSHKSPKKPKTPESGKRGRLMSLALNSGGFQSPPSGLTSKFPVRWMGYRVPSSALISLDDLAASRNFASCSSLAELGFSRLAADSTLARASTPNLAQSFSSSPPTPKTPTFAPVLPSLDFKSTPSMLSIVDTNRSPSVTPVASSTPKASLRHKASSVYDEPPVYTPTARRKASTINLNDSPPSVLSLPTREFIPVQAEESSAQESSTRNTLRGFTSSDLRLLMASGAKSLDLYEVQRLCLLRGVKFDGSDSKEKLLKRMVVAAEISEDAARRIRRAQERIKKRKEIASTVGVEEWELQRSV